MNDYAAVSTPKLKAPWPWFGGKSMIAPVVWQALGDTPNYVEPMFGSGAVLLNRPHKPGVETVNDANGYVSNAWRAIQSDPDAVAYYADAPVNECDLHAKHLWLLQHKDELPLRLMGDPDYYDAKIAGWWIWGISTWIGHGFCSGKGPWYSVDGVFTKVEGDAGNGVNRQLPHLGDAGNGVNRQLPHLGNAGRGVNRQRQNLTGWMQALADRLRRVRVCCGDWTRVIGPSVTHKHGLTGVFLDPPYDLAERDDVYTTDEQGISASVRQWAIENGDNPLLRIVLCGYEGEHDMPDTWRCIPWKTQGGMGSQGNGRGRENATRERLWLSPHCLADERQGQLFRL